MNASTTSHESNHLGQYIPAHYHYQMLLDEQRMLGFKEAIQAIVPSGSKVLELGGGTGVLSFFAAKPAKKVYCVERNPQLVRIAKNLLTQNHTEGIVEVIEADAFTFIPPEPVDVVICEMLHSALLREKQIQVIDAFKVNYATAFPGEKLPKFIPEATFLAVQAVNQDFNFHGYSAPIPVFSPATMSQERTKDLSTPFVYSLCEYGKTLPSNFACNTTLVATQEGICNALRFITKNVLAILLESNSTIDWHNFYLVLPLQEEYNLREGDKLQVSFNYEPGALIETLLHSITVIDTIRILETQFQP